MPAGRRGRPARPRRPRGIDPEGAVGSAESRRLDQLAALLRSPLSLNRLVGLADPTQGERRRRPRRWRRWVAAGCALAVLGAVALETVPRAFGQPSMQSWIVQELKTGTINAFAGQQIEQQVAAERAVAGMSTDQFIIANAAQLAQTQAGDTFIPEWRLPRGVNPLQYIRTSRGRAYQRMALSVLRFEVEQLGLRQIRLGIRWSSTIAPSGHFSLAFYQPYLDFLTTYRAPATGQRVQLLLGVGPLKSPGWPETFVPAPPGPGGGTTTSLTPTGGLPGSGALIQPSMPGTDLIPKSKRWLETLMWQVRSVYPSIDYFQLDNEPRNHGGPRGWVMSSGYEKALAAIVLAYRPGASFLVNWSGTADLTASFNFNGQPSLGEAVRLADIFTRRSVIQEMLSLRRSLLAAIAGVGGSGNVVLGLDSYHLTPDIPQVPIEARVGGNTYQVRLDTTALIEIAEELAGDYSPWELLHSQKVPLEVTEMQAEPWGRFQSPGNDPKELLFEIDRALEVLPPGQPATLRFWRLSDTVYNLMYDPRRFADSSNPISMRGPHGSFKADNWAELEIAAAVGGVSRVIREDGRLEVDNTGIDSAMRRYLARAGSSTTAA